MLVGAQKAQGGKTALIHDPDFKLALHEIQTALHPRRIVNNRHIVNVEVWNFTRFEVHILGLARNSAFGAVINYVAVCIANRISQFTGAEGLDSEMPASLGANAALSQCFARFGRRYVRRMVAR